LLALVCVAQAGIVLEDGYVGSWFDTMYVEGTTDLTAPTFSDFQYYYLDEGDAETNVTFYSDYLTVDFTNDEDSDEAYYGTCTLEYTLWNDAGDTALNTVTCSCSNYYETASCTFMTGIPPGTYMAELTTWDFIGNWQVTTSADDATLMDVVVWNNRVDMMAPMIVSMAPEASATLTIPAMNADASVAGAYVLLSVEAHDNEGTDMWASGVAMGGVTITDSEETMWMALGLDDYGTYDADDNYVKTYGYSIQFYNWADEGTWTIDSFDVVDFAGNWASETAGFVLTLETDVTEVDSGRPPQCDTFGIGDDSYTYYTSSDYNVIMSAQNTVGYYATSYVYFNMECNADYSGWNYAGALFASPQVQLAGATGAMSLWAQTEEGVLPPEQLTVSPSSYEEDIYYVSYPGDTLYGAGDLSYWYDAWYVYNGYPVGEYTLDRVYTTTETGAVQVYDSALGSASSVVPSVVVVAAALAAAMFL
jgi:hypothetical protein